MTQNFQKLEYEGLQRVAGLYETTWASLTRQFIDPLIQTAGIRKGMKVLDVACGPGYVTKALNDMNAIVTGLDFSPEMLGLAKKNYQGH